MAPLRLGLEDADLLLASDVVAATWLEALSTVGRETTLIVDDQVAAAQILYANPNIDLAAVLERRPPLRRRWL